VDGESGESTVVAAGTGVRDRETGMRLVERGIRTYEER